ncbi:MAG: calcium-binding protein, partial [Pseudomonadota bacterium]
MTTSYFRKQPEVEWYKQMYRELLRDSWYCEIDPDKAGTGDIIVWEKPGKEQGHMGIVRTNRVDLNPESGGRSGTVYNSTSRRDRRPDYPWDPFYDPESPPDPIDGDGWTGPAVSPWNCAEGVTFWRPKVCECRPPHHPKWDKPARTPRRIDPLALDLDGGGIRTIAVDNGVFFDHDANGFHEHTGWVAHGDGMLMLDWNNNGRLDSGMELFGEFTLLSTGTPVGGDGFQVLSLFDANHDGKIDAEDPIWSQLKVWQYGEDDVENYDPDESGIISTVEELGITAIYLDSEVCNETDSEGNTQVRSGLFQWADGSTGLVAEYSFTRDTSYTLPTEYLEVPEDVLALPDLMFNGNVYNLQQEMVRDSSGVLKSLVESFISEESSDNRGSIMEQILFRWTGADQVSPEARGPFMDGRKVVVLEQLYGETPANPDSSQAASWEATYHEVFEIFYADLMAQTHLSDLYETITYTWNEEKQDYDIDTTALIAALDQAIADDPVKGKELLSEFARTRRGMGYWDDNCFLSLREHFIEQNPDLAWVFDTGGLPVYNQLGQSPDGWYWKHMFGTWNSDAVQGSATQGDGWINSLTGDDVVYGTDRNEKLLNQDGDSILVAGGGQDTIWAGSGNDILDGGAHDDLLIGEAGDDVYLFRPGSGHDVIRDIDATEGNIDTIWLGGNLTPDDITLKRSGNYLVLEIIATGDTISVEDFFRFESYVKRVEQIQFMDGTTWDETEMIARAYAPTNGPDRIYGGPGDDELSGLGGADLIYGLESNDTLHGDDDNDRLYGGLGADTLEGGSGADRLYGEDDPDVLMGGLDDDYTAGGPGNDTYRFSRGDGHDTIDDTDTTAGNTDTLELGADILPTDVQIQRMGNDLKL